MNVPRRLAVTACLLLTTGTALAATEAEKQAAIDNGLEWLAQTQNASGYWAYGPVEETTAATGAALLAFLEQGWKAGDDVVLNGSHYGDVVGRGLTYVLGKATPYGIGVEPTGNPDSDGNQIGVKFVAGGNNNRDTYVTGLCVPAIARTGTPNALVTVGSLATRTDGSGPGGQWTYRDVVVNATDYFAYGQADPGNTYRGGWRYYADYGQADNSTAQWPPIAMLFSSSMGVSAPGFVKDELAHWIGYIQNANGGSGYDAPWNMVNESKTGGLLAEMKFAGDDTLGNPYNLANADVLRALAYLDQRWQNTQNNTWDGNFGHPYAMWSIYKGLEVTVGLGDTTYITNLHDQTALRGGAGAPLDPGDSWTWWEDYCEWLVTTQNVNGSWNGYTSYWTGPLVASWYINILDATVVQEPVVPLPPAAPSALALLAGLALLRRRRRRRT